MPVFSLGVCLVLFCHPSLVPSFTSNSFVFFFAYVLQITLYMDRWIDLVSSYTKNTAKIVADEFRPKLHPQA